jgi:nitrate/nitrite-specific signal transduction histidine kinase
MKGRIIKAFVTVVSFMFISEVFFVVIHFVVIDKYQRITDNLVSEYQLSKDTSELVNSFYDLIQYSNDQKRVQDFKDNLENLQTLLAKLDTNLANNDSWTVYQGVKNTINVVISEVNKGNEEISAGNFSEVTASYLKAVQNNNYVRENTGGLLLKELENVKVLQAEIAITKFWSELFGLILCAVSIIGSLLYARYSIKKINEPVRRLNESLKKINAGNFDERVGGDLDAGENEMTTLAKSIDSIRLLLKNNAQKSEAKDGRFVESKNIIDNERPGADRVKE